MPRILHAIERRIIASLRDRPGQSRQEIEESTGLGSDQVRRGIEWLRLKGLADIAESESHMLRLGANGMEALESGLPERRLLDALAAGPVPIPELQDGLGDVFGSAMGQARKNGWVTVSGGQVSPGSMPGVLPGERALAEIGTGRVPADKISQADLAAIRGRPDFVIDEVVKTGRISLRDVRYDESIQPEKAIDVEADVPMVHVARTHPLRDVMDEIREIFVTLGFSEITGGIVQPSFWNFDALFTPQDHPAREMQDTFYLDGIESGRAVTAEQIRNVSASHKRNWGYMWDVAESRRMVLRTHTTCVTIRHLAENRPDETRVFSLGRVFRNEKPSYKHLVEFNQIEGVVADRDTTLRDLMGIQREFYRRLGLGKVTFWPTYFPYTEPSLQTMVYNESLDKWVEMFGMGMLRPEVTRPLGIRGQVLAWGGGIERIAMLKYGIDDVRTFYENRLDWLRGMECR